MVVDEVGGAEDEHLAHHVRVLLVAAHEADHLTASSVLDDAGERPCITSWNSIRCWITTGPRPPSSSVCSTREKLPRSTQTTKSSLK